MPRPMNAGDLFDVRRSTAVISDDGVYRYSLTRSWADVDDRVVFVMLNPSTADATVDDPTIRRCIGFAKAWGYPGLAVVNLFAFRATSPADLKRAADPVGPQNDEVIETSIWKRDVIAAWGTHGAWRDRNQRVTKLIRRDCRSVTCFGTTKEGHPRHPLYVPAAQTRIPFHA